MTGRKKITSICCILLMGLLGLCSCGSPSSDSVENTLSDTSENSTVLEQTENAEENNEVLVYESSMELKYAENFYVDYYVGGYKLLTVKDGTKLLVVPEGKAVPEDLDEDVYIMQQPIENLYLVATAVMDMFDSLDAVDSEEYFTPSIALPSLSVPPSLITTSIPVTVYGFSFVSG